MALGHNGPLDQFGELVAAAIEDAYQQYASQVTGRTNAVGADRIATAARGREEEFLLAGEEAMFNMFGSLFAAIEAVDHVAIVVDGVAVDEKSDGLLGELVGDAGWIARFTSFNKGFGAFERSFYD